jgi:CelD/BcsL family acetyltransferase involved in cellulose biosynthesis
MSDIDLVDRAETRAREEAPVREPARNVLSAHPKPAKPPSLAGIRIAVHNDLNEIKQDWLTFEKDAACTVFQTYGWLSKWQRNIGEPARILPVIVTGHDAAGALLFILPFAIETRGLLRRLTWLGRELCDYNAPIATPDFLHDIGAEGFAALWRAIIARIRDTSRTRFDLIDLDKMPEHVGGQSNPFAGLDVLAHPCGAHVSTLGEDWEKFYASKRSSATRKKERKKLRQLGEHGEVRLVSASAHEDRVEIMKVLIGQKSHWFARMGVKDIFARAGTRDFFMDVAADPAMQDIVHVSRLSVGETAAATSVGLRFRDCYYLVLSSYLDAEISRLGPGRTHLHELLRYAIAKGFRWFDFTVGDEPYKRDWSDKVVKLYDYLEPITLRGRLAALTLLGYRTLKRFIKNTPILWRAYSSLRLLKGRWCGGAKGTSESEQGAE